MSLHYPFGHLKHKLWSKERLGVKLLVWLLTTKCQELTLFPCVQATCNIQLKSSWQRLQLWFRPHCNWRSSREVMRFKIVGVLVVGILGLPLGSFETKSHLDVAPMESCRVYYKGEGGGFPQVRAMVSLRLHVARPSTKSVPTMHYHVGFMQVRVSNWSLSILPSPIPEFQYAPLPL
jgi:hypothetical protein